MSLRRFVMAAAAVFCCVAPAAAQAVKLQFDSGRVSLSAQNVPLRTILNEWARLGGTKIVNGERVPGGLVTIELTNVPERQALDTLLRAASGYLAGPRPAGTPGASAFASILILPTSSAPRPPTTPQPGASPPIFAVPQPQPTPVFPGQGRPIPGRQVAPPPDPDDDPAGDVPPPEDNPDDAPPPSQRGRVVGGVVQPTQPRPFQPGDDDAPAPPVASPGNPFGIPAGSTRPGEITPVPQQPQPPRSRPDPEP